MVEKIGNVADLVGVVTREVAVVNQPLPALEGETSAMQESLYSEVASLEGQLSDVVIALQQNHGLEPQNLETDSELEPSERSLG